MNTCCPATCGWARKSPRQVQLEREAEDLRVCYWATRTSALRSSSPGTSSMSRRKNRQAAVRRLTQLWQLTAAARLRTVCFAWGPEGRERSSSTWRRSGGGAGWHQSCREGRPSVLILTWKKKRTVLMISNGSLCTFIWQESSK